VLREASPPPTQPAEREQAAVFSRTQVRRLLNVAERLLRSWERQGLIPQQDEYRFSDLLVLKTILKLRDAQVPPQRIRRSLLALRERLKDAPDLYSEIRVFSQGQRVQVQIGKQQMEPISGQFLLDFSESEVSKLLHLPKSSRDTEKTADLLRRKMESENWFERGLELEQRGAPVEQIIDAYQKAAALDPRAAGALVNLGTIFFNGHAWADAETHYKKALEIDPDYPLAHFNLGNLYDERGDYETAVFHYLAAVRLFPNYADAHYNIALLYQNAGEVMNAVRHWKQYLKLDTNTAWSHIARRELSKLEAITVVAGSRPPRSVPGSRAGES
jgi:tetratricopeptide (TPR) repeat protein